MIAGTGIDMVEVARIAEKVSKEKGFREKIFSANEIAYCESMTNKAEHYAARFAAKEAFLKATGLGLMAGFDLSNIELFHDRAGKPHLKLTGAFEAMAKENNWTAFHVSLSHVQLMACAVVIIEK